MNIRTPLAAVSRLLRRVTSRREAASPDASQSSFPTAEQAAAFLAEPWRDPNLSWDGKPALVGGARVISPSRPRPEK